jgi:hypothetical protein
MRELEGIVQTLETGKAQLTRARRADEALFTQNRLVAGPSVSHPPPAGSRCASRAC